MKWITKAAAPALYVLLAACMAMAVLAAAAGYAETERLAEKGQSERVAAQFIRTRMRQGDAPGAIGTGSMPAVTILEEYPEGRFTTGLYAHDGWLMEQLFAENVPFDPAMGDRLIRADGLEASRLPGGLVRYSVNGAAHLAYARSGHGVIRYDADGYASTEDLEEWNGIQERN